MRYELFYTLRTCWILGLSYWLRKFSQRARDKYIIRQTIQALLPVNRRDCEACEGLRCQSCDYTGLEQSCLVRRRRLVQEAMLKSDAALIRMRQEVAKINDRTRVRETLYVYFYNSCSSVRGKKDG